PAAVQTAVESLCLRTWPDMPREPLLHAFDHFERLFSGKVPGYFGVDTVYHDVQHTLDVTLAFVRLMVGYERQVEPELRLGAERALAGIITALFHDVGYLRRSEERDSRNG